MCRGLAAASMLQYDTDSYHARLQLWYRSGIKVPGFSMLFGLGWNNTKPTVPMCIVGVYLKCWLLQKLQSINATLQHYSPALHWL